MAGQMVTLDPGSVRAYGSAAQEIFGRIRSELEGMVQDVVNVEYKGENAVQFKTDCGRIAGDFGTAIAADMRSIAEAVRATTSNIAGALGGGPVVVDVNGSPVNVPPVPAGDGTYSLDPGGLEALKGAVQRRFGAINEQFDAHQQRLQSTNWTGNAKEQAMQAVGQFTGSARGKMDEARSELTGFIDKQLEAMRTADKQQ